MRLFRNPKHYFNFYPMEFFKGQKKNVICTFVYSGGKVLGRGGMNQETSCMGMD